MPVVSDIGAGEHVDVGMHPRVDVPQLSFTEVSYGPPHARVDEREHLLADVRISALRDGEVGYPRVKGRIDTAIVQVVFGVADDSSLAGRAAR